MSVTIRPFHTDDAAHLFAMFYDAVHRGAATAYTPEQRTAWAPSATMPDGWPDRLKKLETRVAVTANGPAGFMAMDANGYIDLAFTHPDHTRKGVAAALYCALLEHARATGLDHLTTHASRLARPFFAAQGWQVDAIEHLERGGEALERFAMSLPTETLV